MQYIHFFNMLPCLLIKKKILYVFDFDQVYRFIHSLDMQLINGTNDGIIIFILHTADEVSEVTNLQQHLCLKVGDIRIKDAQPLANLQQRSNSRDNVRCFHLWKLDFVLQVRCRVKTQNSLL